MAVKKGQAALESHSGATARHLRGQAALDFLMTYGWAIALVVIVAAALFSLGIFDMSNFIGSKAAGFSGVMVQGWQMSTNGTLQLKLSNQVGQRISVTNVTATVGTIGPLVLSGPPLTLNTGDTTSNALTVSGFGSQSGYNAKIIITYTDLNSLFNASTSGTLTGKAV
jgi:hypothetical protein